MTDFLLLENLHKMIKKNVTKPRLMFRKGVVAEGFFRPYMSFDDYTEASVFKNFDVITPVKVRFSSFLGDEGTADTLRNIKSMNIRFHAEEGYYDMFCSSLPVFFINSQSKFLDMTAAFTKNRPFDGINSSDFWRFVTENKEAANCAVRLFSHEGFRASYIFSKWFSVEPTVWINSRGERFLIKYSWVPLWEEGSYDSHGTHIDRISAEFLAGFDSDHASNEIKREIDSGRFPCYELHVQVADIKRSGECSYTQRTLLWDKNEIPPVAAGVMRITGLGERKESACEKLSFIPSNTIDGIEMYRDDFSQVLNYLYKIEAAERSE